MSNVSWRYARVKTGEKELGNAFNNRASDPSLTKKLAEKRTLAFFASSGPIFWRRIRTVGTTEQTSHKDLLPRTSERCPTRCWWLCSFRLNALMNGSSLTRVSTDPTDGHPLTSNHFLDQLHQYFPPKDHSIFEKKARRYWRYAQIIVDQYWKRWMMKYVHTLIERKKWFLPNRNVDVGDWVIIDWRKQ